MATISFSNGAPEVDGSVRFSFANKEFEVPANGEYETDDNDLIEGANVHPWLKVDLPPAPATKPQEVDESDPHQNPAADHLGSEASPEAIEKAKRNNEAIQRGELPTEGVAAASEVSVPVLPPTPEDDSVAASTPEDDSVAASTVEGEVS